jgi:hypothetical protein
MVAMFSVDESVLTSRKIMLDTTNVIVRGRGEIDVTGQSLDIIVSPQAKREKFLSMSTPVAITGPLHDFQVGVTRVGMVATMFRWYMGLIYVPFKWLTGERFPADGLTTCFSATDWELPSDSD